VRSRHQKATLKPRLSETEVKPTESRDSIEQISGEVLICRKCRLCETRKKAVPGEGSNSARVVFVGEAPGEQEDLQGRPFVGAAGKLLTELLQSVNLRREDVYITNTVKCRPPNNRPPRKDETASCRPYLDRQLSIISPKVICPMGNSAIHAFLDSSESVSALHGIPFEVQSITYFPMYHPAAALYTFSLRKVMEEDFRKLRALLDSIAE
jgi:uracil-DNA glycosylase family 4